MTEKTQNTLGVFAVPIQYDEELAAEVARVDGAMFGEPRRRWYELRHELFEHLLKVAKKHRVLKSATAEQAFVALVRSVGPRKTWESVSPMRRMELAREHVDRVTDLELRDALLEMFAESGQLGLWIETDAAPPPDPELGPASKEEEVDAEEIARRLDGFFEKNAREDFLRKRRR